MAGKCSVAYYTDEYHGYGCSVTEGSACFFILIARSVQRFMEKALMQMPIVVKNHRKIREKLPI